MHSWNDKKLRQKTAGGGRVLESGLRLYTELKFARKPPFSPYAATDDNRLEVKYPCLDANEPEDEQPEDDDIEQRSGGLADLANTAKKPLEGCKLRTYVYAEFTCELKCALPEKMSYFVRFVVVSGKLTDVLSPCFLSLEPPNYSNRIKKEHKNRPW